MSYAYQTSGICLEAEGGIDIQYIFSDHYGFTDKEESNMACGQISPKLTE